MATLVFTPLVVQHTVALAENVCIARAVQTVRLTRSTMLSDILRYVILLYLYSAVSVLVYFLVSKGTIQCII